MKLLIFLFVCGGFLASFSVVNSQQTMYMNNPCYRKAQQVGGKVTVNQVTITVGETEGNFKYTANGITYENQVIRVSGKYYNNDLQPRSGYAWLYLTVPSGINYWDTGSTQDRLLVYAENRFTNSFCFEVIPPYPVHPLDLTWERFNATTILVQGPPKALVYG